MGRTLVLLAPAKINVYLEIGHRRGDGYHNIISIFQTVSLFDRLKIQPLRTPNLLEMSGDLPAGSNTITQSVDLLRRYAGIDAGVSIRVEKGIPAGAGLGGGSSDAAAVLRGLNRMWHLKLSDKQLCDLGRQIGSDVPFFLNGRAALVWGRGEHVQPLESRRDFWIVLVHPGFPVITREAYQWLDNTPNRSLPGLARAELERMYRRPLQEMVFFNSFHKIVADRFPQISAISKVLERSGACHAGISGSGSTVMGFFNRQKTALVAIEALSPYSFVKMVKPL